MGFWGAPCAATAESTETRIKLQARRTNTGNITSELSWKSVQTQDEQRRGVRLEVAVNALVEKRQRAAAVQDASHVGLREGEPLCRYCLRPPPAATVPGQRLRARTAPPVRSRCGRREDCELSACNLLSHMRQKGVGCEGVGACELFACL